MCLQIVCADRQAWSQFGQFDALAPGLSLTEISIPLRRHSTVHKRLLSALYWLHMLRTDVYTPQALITFNGYCKLVCGS